MDTLGKRLEVVVHAANIHDRDGARLLLERLGKEAKSIIKLIWAYGAYKGRWVRWVREKAGRPAGGDAESVAQVLFAATGQKIRISGSVRVLGSKYRIVGILVP